MRERPPAMKERVRRKANGKKTCLDPERESLRWSAMADEVTERLRRMLIVEAAFAARDAKAKGARSTSR